MEAGARLRGGPASLNTGNHPVTVIQLLPLFSGGDGIGTR